MHPSKVPRIKWNLGVSDAQPIRSQSVSNTAGSVAGESTETI